MQPGLERALVPALILQPLVENAIRHGIAPVPEPGRVTLWARRRRTGGCGWRWRTRAGGCRRVRWSRPGVGIRNTLARLDALYGGGAALRLENLPAGGVRATLDLPVRVAGAEAEAEVVPAYAVMARG